MLMRGLEDEDWEEAEFVMKEASTDRNLLEDSN